jgi:hypothetical protein
MLNCLIADAWLELCFKTIPISQDTPYLLCIYHLRERKKERKKKKREQQLKQLIGQFQFPLLCVKDFLF